MIGTLKKYIKNQFVSPLVKETDVVEAYDIWADNYDNQPNNLMLHLDGILFNELLENVDIQAKKVADIGCGTGRHWPVMFKNEPESLTGFDVSPGMLQKLKDKFPLGDIQVIGDNDFFDVKDNIFDTIISTLTVAHIEKIDEALNSWSRILKNDGDIIITDFHPDALASGGQRTFKHEGKHIAVRNFVHSIDTIKKIFFNNGFQLVNAREMKVDETVKHYYQKQNAMHVYEKFMGSPIIYGLHFRRK